MDNSTAISVDPQRAARPAKRRIRLLLRLTLAAAGLLLITMICCLDGVDHRPYFRQDYYRETTALWQARQATNAIVYGELKAGFAKAVLTPNVHAAQDNPDAGQFRALPLAGYGDRKGRPATGVHDELYIKAVALQVGQRTGVMVAADALIIPPEIAESATRQLQQELGLEREQIYLSATHTHASLGGWGEGLLAESFSGDFQPGSRTWFAGRIVAAVREAMADRQPAQVGRGAFPAPNFVRNRVVGELGKVDPEFSFMIIQQSAGRTAVIGSYAAHATVLSGRNMEFSADYPGYWQRAVEESTGGLALFVAGGVGSHAPVPGGSGFDGAEKMGRALAAPLLERLPQTPLTNFVAFGMFGLEVSLPPLNVRVTDGVRLRPWLASRLVSPRRQTYLQAFRLDRAIWISTPCDFSGELALDIKDTLAVDGYSAVVTSFNGDYVGYVIPCRYYHLNGYEPRIMSFFGPNVPDYFEELIQKLASSLSRN